MAEKVIHENAERIRFRQNRTRRALQFTIMILWGNGGKKQIIKMRGSDKKERDDKATVEVVWKLHMSCVFYSFFQALPLKTIMMTTKVRKLSVASSPPFGIANRFKPPLSDPTAGTTSLHSAQLPPSLFPFRWWSYRRNHSSPCVGTTRHTSECRVTCS